MVGVDPSRAHGIATLPGMLRLIATLVAVAQLMGCHAEQDAAYTRSAVAHDEAAEAAEAAWIEADKAETAAKTKFDAAKEATDQAAARFGNQTSEYAQAKSDQDAALKRWLAASKITDLTATVLHATRQATQAASKLFAANPRRGGGEERRLGELRKADQTAAEAWKHAQAAYAEAPADPQLAALLAQARAKSQLAWDAAQTAKASHD